MKKLGINTATGVYSIVSAVLYLISIFVVVGAIANDVVTLDADASTTIGTMIFFYIVAGAGLILSIISLIKSKQNNMKIVGQILAIIGHGVFLLFGLTMFWASMVLLILAAVFVLKNNKVA